MLQQSKVPTPLYETLEVHTKCCSVYARRVSAKSPSVLYRSGMIDATFNRTLLKLLGEMRYWERLRFEVPHYATGIYRRGEDLRVLRENILLIVRDYNRIINSLQPSERSLFRERIRSLDKKIRPGMTKLTWASEGILDYFVNDCRVHAQKVRIMIDNYKASNRSIGANCRKMSEMLLVRLDGKRVYEENEFEEEQHRHRDCVQQKLQQIHNEIVLTMQKTYEVSGNGVQPPSVCVVTCILTPLTCT